MPVFGSGIRWSLGVLLGLSVEGLGTLFSYGDNDIDGNANNNSGVLTVIPTH